MDELEGAADELDLATAKSVSFNLHWPGDDPVGTTFSVFETWNRRWLSLDVKGRKVTAAEGVMASAANVLDGMAKRLAEESAREGAAAQQGSAGAAPPLQRFLAHPYSVQVIGGVVAGVILLVIAAVIFSQG